MTAAQIIVRWKATPNGFGIADDLRCAAMEVQEDFPEITRNDFVTAAEICGYNRSTAARCWSYVSNQGAN